MTITATVCVIVISATALVLVVGTGIMDPFYNRFPRAVYGLILLVILGWLIGLGLFVSTKKGANEGGPKEKYMDDFCAKGITTGDVGTSPDPKQVGEGGDKEDNQPCGIPQQPRENPTKDSDESQDTSGDKTDRDLTNRLNMPMGSDGDLPQGDETDPNKEEESEECRIIRAYEQGDFDAKKINQESRWDLKTLQLDSVPESGTDDNKVVSFRWAKETDYKFILVKDKYLFFNEKPEKMEAPNLETAMGDTLWDCIYDYKLPSNVFKSKVIKPAYVTKVEETKYKLADKGQIKFYTKEDVLAAK